MPRYKDGTYSNATAHPTLDPTPLGNIGACRGATDTRTTSKRMAEHGSGAIAIQRGKLKSCI